MGADTRQVSGEVAARFVLGLTAGCSDEDVKRAFRRLALIFHPDKNPGDDAEEAKRRFHAIVKAKECLLATLSKGGGGGGSGRTYPPPPTPTWEQQRAPRRRPSAPAAPKAQEKAAPQKLHAVWVCGACEMRDLGKIGRASCRERV